MNLSPNFTLEEMTRSSTADRLEIANDPPPAVVANLAVAAAGMEEVRRLLGGPIHVDSGYRCAALNKAVNGAPNSAHMTGYAVDFTCAPHTTIEIVEAIRHSSISFDQVIQEGTWVHISFDPRRRRETLTAHFGAGGTVYTPGVGHG